MSRCVVVIVVALVVVLASNQAEGKYGGGSGTSEDPYQIWDANHMQAIGADPCDWDKHFVLMADVDMSAYTGTQYNLIGNYTTSFKGGFDGNGHVIRNFTYTAEYGYEIGLFGWVSAWPSENLVVIKDLTLEDVHVEVENGERIGGLAGDNYSGTITNCHVTGYVSGNDSVGGMVGKNWSNIIGCSSDVEVSGIEMVGGLIGHTDEGSVKVCRSAGTVVGETQVGGLIGTAWEGIVEDSNSTATVSGGTYVGGLAGTNTDTIVNCHVNCEVSGEYNVGGLVGRNYQGIVSNCYSAGDVNGVYSVGGLVGENADGRIWDCYSTGDVNGDDTVGGLAGQNDYDDYGSITNCFWDTDTQTHGVTESIWDDDGPATNVHGLPTSQLHQQSTFTGWDFIGVWNIGENQTYPYLRRYPAADLNHDRIVNFTDYALICEEWMNEE